MKKMSYSETSICWHNIDCYLWEVVQAVQRRCACTLSSAESLAEPLVWYVRTGRASCDFLHRMIKVKPFMIARRIAEGGSTDEVVERLKTLINKE